MVRNGRKELVDQVAMSHMELKNLKARLKTPPSGAFKITNHFLHVFATHFLRSGRVLCKRYRTRCQRSPPSLRLRQHSAAKPRGCGRSLSSGMGYLNPAHRTLGVHEVRDSLETKNVLI